jgi:hypothetical protein
MIKCLECGFETLRLQWSHFKYNCTGKFANGKEYLKTYPNASLVDPYLAKSYALTLDKFIQKYGDVEGKRRWESYRKKQSYSNSFEYKKEKHGWTKEQFDEYNSSRAQTLEKMISRYGESEGIERWHKYCDRQAYTNTKEYFIEKYGQDEGYQKYLKINKEKSSGVPAILAEKLQITVEEATDIIIRRYKKLFTSNLEREFTTLLETKIGNLEHTSFAKPFGKWSPLLNSYVIYDIKHGKCIVEFNGDYWHANPKIYQDTAIIRGKTAAEIRQKDFLKIKTAEDLGFKTLVVWESDFLNDKSETIVKVAQWISNEQK